ncbi:hypothetical protein HOLDEFILI_03008 [Holdemania filiformis DSM 12042]|uniref:Uncharacterized protein n=1 Tax=Holdemania filiformis DSM 12042 TaxID=545696 RepID=B9YB01_9FIRM|nr:hypothetical protein HOLDEFILI_03008 [Holdemania filiformis DSM 12042]
MNLSQSDKAEKPAAAAGFPFHSFWLFCIKKTAEPFTVFRRPDLIPR